MNTMNNDNVFKHLTVKQKIFDKFSAYCKISRRSKVDQLEIIIEDFLRDKYIPEKTEAIDG